MHLAFSYLSHLTSSVSLHSQYRIPIILICKMSSENLRGHKKAKKVDRRRIKTHEDYLKTVKHSAIPKAYHSHLIHTDITSRDWSDEPFIRLVIIDPGKVNLGFRIEKRILKTREVVTEFMTRKRIAEDDDYKPAVPLYGNVLAFLESFTPLFLEAHIILIEKQVVANTGMTILGPFIVGYFSTLLRNAPLLPLIIEMFPTMKTDVLADKHLKTRLGPKKWSIRIAKSLLSVRKDDKGLSLFDADPNKQDDMADVIVMPEAFLLNLLFEFHFPFIQDLYKVVEVRNPIRKRLDKARLLHLVEE